jgi:NitT/TauT family transport system substrate-binding protein
MNAHLAGRGATPRSRLRQYLLAIAACMLLLACRPPIAGEGGDATDSPGPGESPAPTETAAPAVALKPDVLTSVSVQLFRGFGPADAPLQYGQALDSYAASNIALNLTPPIAGYDPFVVQPADNSVNVWVGTAADVAPAKAAGLDLVAVGEITGRDPTVLVVPAAAEKDPLTALSGQTVLADTAGAAASMEAALVEAGMKPGDVTVIRLDDSSAPFDPTQLLDGTVAAAAVSSYDGRARIQEAVVMNGGDPATYVARDLRPVDEALLGELIWAQKSDIADPALGPAITAFLAVVAQTQVACSQAVEDCAGAAASQSDRTPEGLAWSIDQLDRVLFPSADGILHIEKSAWDRTIAAMQAAEIAGVDGLSFTNDLTDAVTQALGSQLDLKGADFAPRDDLPLFPPADGGASPSDAGGAASPSGEPSPSDSTAP